MRRALLSALFVLSAILIYAGWASASPDAGPVASPPATGEASGAVGLILTEVLKLVAALVAVLATWLVGRLTKVLEQRTGIHLSAQQENTVRRWVMEGVALAEEKAHQAIKSRAGAMQGPKKLEVALDYVMPLVRDKGWAEYGRERVVKMLEAELGMTRPRATDKAPPPLPEVDK